MLKRPVFGTYHINPEPLPMNAAHPPRPHAADAVYKWYYRAQLDYFDAYADLFIAYNAWFSKATGQTQDRAALEHLKGRRGIWDDYFAGQAMPELRPHFAAIVARTRQRPVANLSGSGYHWDGEVLDEQDFAGLIEYWYRIRCNLFHGTKSPDDDREAELVRLAYHSLNAFMGEIVKRLHSGFGVPDLDRMYELKKLLEHPTDAGAATTDDTIAMQEFEAQYRRKLQAELAAIEHRLQQARGAWQVDV